MRILVERPQSSCCAVEDLTVLLRRPYGVPTASMSVRKATSRTVCMLKACAVAWRARRPAASNGDATALLRLCKRPYCARLGVRHFLWTPRDCHEDAALV
ncbi:hypothetical protein KP79_PYT21798 [Mizuhopecten yessoensis]|uniref:Uncharacterized protein n=1 Tax=Mizuhopecten yessoensis TaxID=6573 RepID=A0A210Q3W8_MIZYE|nr:hypothetical protein KP79_PYT21798 [Mizuhopecten yessoensis]